MPAFETAVEILRNSSVPTEVFSETEADQLAVAMEREIAAHG
jgi:hypothetical protein